MIKERQYILPPSRDRLLLKSDRGPVGISLPVAGESSYFQHIDRLLTEVVQGLADSYAPRRMVKIGSPTTSRGVAIPSNGSIRFQVPAWLVKGDVTPIPFLILRQNLTNYNASTFSGYWKLALIAPLNDAGTSAVPRQHISVRVISTPETENAAKAGMIAIESKYSSNIELRGAIYFPKPHPIAISKYPEYFNTL